MAWSARTMQRGLPATYRAQNLHCAPMASAARLDRYARGRDRQAILVANVLECNRQDIPREPLEDRRKRLAGLLSRPKGKAAQTIATGHQIRA
jgi:hypothetical protein